MIWLTVVRGASTNQSVLQVTCKEHVRMYEGVHKEFVLGQGCVYSQATYFTFLDWAHSSNLGWIYA